MSQLAFESFLAVSLLEVDADSRILGDFDVRERTILPFFAAAFDEVNAMLHRVRIARVTKFAVRKFAFFAF